VQVKTTMTKIKNNPVSDKFLILSNSLVLVNLTKKCVLLEQFLVGWFFVFHFALKSTIFGWFDLFC